MTVAQATAVFVNEPRHYSLFFVEEAIAEAIVVRLAVEVEVE